MATLPTLNDAIKAVIYKKVDDNGTIKYVPYFPRTDAEWVSLNESINIHGTSESANTDMETIVKALNTAIGATNAAASSATTASLQAQITYAISKINEQAGAFIYKGSITPVSGTPVSPAANAQPGWVYNVTTPFNINSSGQIVYVQFEKDAQYSAGTNVVVYGSGTTADPFKFDALAGDMGNHALTSEAVGYIGTDSDGRFAWGYVSDGAATRSFGLPFTTTSSLSSNYYIPLVYNNGGQTASTVYISSGVRFTNTGVLDVTVSTANYTDYADSADTANTANSASYASSAGHANSADTATSATTADHVGHSLTIGGLTYSGAADLNIQLSSGLQMVNPSAGVHLLAVKTTTNSGLGFDSSTNSMFVQLASAGGLSSSGSGLALSETGIGTGTYSALQVDAKGRAVAGAQSIVFANSTSDPDLNQLVVGGLAFISSSETAKTGTVPTNSMDLNN